MNAARHVRIFKNGRSRAIRIPKDFDIFGDEVVIRQDGNRLILEQATKKPTIGELLARWRSEPPLEEDFSEIYDPLPEPVTDFD